VLWGLSGERAISDNEIVDAVFSCILKSVSLLRLPGHLQSLIYEASVETEEDLVATVLAAREFIQNFRATP
jgi:hypothetical protein